MRLEKDGVVMTTTTTLEEVLLDSSGEQMRSMALKVWGALGAPEERAKNLERWRRGELKIVFEEVIRIFFDGNHGRRIPHDLKAAVCDANKAFRIDPASFAFDPKTCLDRLQRHFPKDSRWFVPVKEFAKRVEAILARIRTDAQVANLLKGPYFPFAIPQMEVGDYGAVLENTFLAALEASYKEIFPNREFNNHRKGELAEQVTILPGTRHEKVVASMAKGAVVGVYFPCLQGFSVDAHREQLAELPDWLLLSGGFDTVAALTSCTDVLARDYHTPGLEMSAVQWQSVGCSFGSEAYTDKLYVGRRICLGRADGRCSGGLSVLG